MDEIHKGLETVTYQYKPVSVPGGGFVTGFVFHPNTPDILFCRTDIGGCYRYNVKDNAWVSLIDHATDVDVWETYPLALALDPQNPSYVYTMVGLDPVAKIGFSKDYGETWIYYDAPVVDETGRVVSIHGNAPGRSTGERLVVDPRDSQVLYMGTMADGLWKTTDGCQNFQKLSIDEINISFVEILELREGCFAIIVATSGEKSSPDGKARGHSLYVSYDEGETFEVLTETLPHGQTGMVGQRLAFAAPYVYITMSAYDIPWASFRSYGCDTGLASDGCVLRWTVGEDGRLTDCLDVSPVQSGPLHYGFSGISCDNAQPGTLICSTICAGPDTIYYSKDDGLHWRPIMSGLEVGKIDFNVAYQKPEYNGHGSLIHWMSDLKIDPFNGNRALFNTGAGVFMTENLRNARDEETVVFACCDTGIEETVHLNIYSPPSGDVKLIDIIGDYGGIIFKDLDKPVENSFANEQGDRWITAMNADFPDRAPNLLVTAPRGNWTGRTKGGVILSEDQGETWRLLESPIGLSKAIDEVVESLKRPNVTAGWVALSASGETLVWGIGLPIYTSMHVYTQDQGETWGKVQVFSATGESFGDNLVPFKVFADRLDPSLFYGFSDHQQGQGFYVSLDSGKTFVQKQGPDGFPSVSLAGIDSEQAYEIRVVGQHIWMAMEAAGLWSVSYDIGADRFVGSCVSQEGDFIKRIGLGKGSGLAGDYELTLYTSGTIKGTYGCYRSLDGGTHWQRINDDKHQYGDIRSISGDPRIFGRIYVATGTRGVVYGDPI